MERIAQAEAGFRSLTEATDTTTPAGRMRMQMIGSFAVFERAMLHERTQAGLAAPPRSSLSPGIPPVRRDEPACGAPAAASAGPPLARGVRAAPRRGHQRAGWQQGSPGWADAVGGKGRLIFLSPTVLS